MRVTLRSGLRTWGRRGRGAGRFICAGGGAGCAAGLGHRASSRQGIFLRAARCRLPGFAVPDEVSAVGLLPQVMLVRIRASLPARVPPPQPQRKGEEVAACTSGPAGLASLWAKGWGRRPGAAGRGRLRESCGDWGLGRAGKLPRGRPLNLGGLLRAPQIPWHLSSWE